MRILCAKVGYNDLGRLIVPLTDRRVDWEATDDFHPDDTKPVEDFEKNHFLDLRKPLLRQVWEANFRRVTQVILRSSTYPPHMHRQQIVLLETSTPTASPIGVCSSLWTGLS